MAGRGATRALRAGAFGAQSRGAGVQGGNRACQRISGRGLIDASDQLICGQQVGGGQIGARACIHFGELGTGGKAEQQEKGAHHAAEHTARGGQVQCAGFGAMRGAIQSQVSDRRKYSQLGATCGVCLFLNEFTQHVGVVWFFVAIGRRFQMQCV